MSDSTEQLRRETGKKLVIVDARNGVERKLLLGWMRTAWGTLAPEDFIVLTLSSDHENLDLADLSERLGSADHQTQVIPVRVTWRIPHFDKDRPLRLRDIVFGDPRHPGRIRSHLNLLLDRQRAQCLMGEPASIEALRDRFARTAGSSAPDFAVWVARQAALALDIAERGVRGTRYKVPRFIADSISSNERFRGEMEALAEENGASAQELAAEARKYMKELISTPSAIFIDMRARLERFMMTQGYDKGFRVDPEEVEALKEMVRTKPTVLLFTHKTYLDGVTPNVLAYDHDMTTLHTFGGINLDFMVIGPLLRRSGTIFIRRSFQSLPVYKAVLRHYIAYLLEKRFPMSWALEGTRSRLGKLMPPKYGILKYVIDAAHHRGIEDLHIVPFVTSFDLIRDVEEYAAEQAGRKKQPESLSWFIGYLKSLREPMGRVRIDLGKPVVLPTAPDPEDRMALARIAFDASVSANRATPLTVTSLMCMTLLGAAPRGATAEELTRITIILIDWANARGIRLSEELATLDRAAITATADKLVNSGLILRDNAGRDTVYTIEPAKHPMASYYRNTIIHHFLDKTLIELALFRLEEDGGENLQQRFWDEVDRLRDLFKFEFFYQPREVFHAEIKAELDRTDPRWSQRLEAGKTGIKSLIRKLQPLMGHAALLPFVEAYIVVFEMLARLEEGEAPELDQIVEQGLIEGRQALLLRRITSEASIGKILFENGFRLAENEGLAGNTDAAVIKRRKAFLSELRSLARRMERMRIEVLAAAEIQDSLGVRI